MVDSAAIEQRLELIEEELAVLDRARRGGRERYLRDRSLQRETERALQLSIQACIDIGSQIVAAGGLGVPNDYADVFELLERGAALDGGLAGAMRDATRQRNLLVHVYLAIDPARIFEKLEEAEALRAFAGWAMEQATREPEE